jgi:hypothetical protein
VEQQHVICPIRKRGAMVSSVEPEGTLLERLEEGKVAVVMQGGEKPQYETNKEVLLGAAIKLRLLTQAISGAITLMPSEDLTVTYLGTERLAGRLSHKIEISGRLFDREELLTSTALDKMVVWINAETNLIDRIWMRYPRDGRKEDFGFLAVNLGKFIKINEGLIVPSYLEFVQSDSYQQISQRQFLVVEYLRLRANQKEKSNWMLPFYGRK